MTQKKGVLMHAKQLIGAQIREAEKTSQKLKLPFDHTVSFGKDKIKIKNTIINATVKRSDIALAIDVLYLLLSRVK